jgi:hypothetical protein
MTSSKTTLPNVKTAKEERDALKKRYIEAYQKARQRGIDKKLREFEQAVQLSYATINVNFIVLYNLAKKDENYKNYYEVLEDKRQKSQEVKEDDDREMVDRKLFQQARHQIRYAALSLGGTGLTEYGRFCLCLNEQSIQNKASLLEENSFNFFKRHPIQPKMPMLEGYRAIWQDRSKLAVAKLSRKIQPTMDSKEFATLLLSNRHDRDLDEFIEVHIHGQINFQMVTKVYRVDTFKQLITEINNMQSPERRKKWYLAFKQLKERLGQKWEHYSQ